MFVQGHLNGRPRQHIELVVGGEGPVHEVGVQVVQAQRPQRLLARLSHARVVLVMQLQA